jgi:hypothetical protein
MLKAFDTNAFKSTNAMQQSFISVVRSYLSSSVVIAYHTHICFYH